MYKAQFVSLHKKSKTMQKAWFFRSLWNRSPPLCYPRNSSHKREKHS